MPALLRRSLRACSSKMSRRSSIFILLTSSAWGADTAVSRRAIESSARSASSLENGAWCAQLLRWSRISLTRLRSAWPSVLRNTSFQVSHISFSRPATSHCATGLLASIGSSAKRRTVSMSHGACLHGRVDLAFNEGRQAGFQQVQRLGDPFLVGDGHGSVREQKGGQQRQQFGDFHRHGLPDDFMIDVGVSMDQPVAHADEFASTAPRTLPPAFPERIREAASPTI